MRLPSGRVITKEDYDYLVSVIKPKKDKPKTEGPCWYCGNGQHERVEAGKHSFELCTCGASIVIWPKRKAHKALPYAKLAAEVGTRFAPYHQANLLKMKRLIK